VTFYPSVDEVIALHARLIAQFGGSLGIRDRGALESAIARPQSRYYADIIQEAAALWEASLRIIHSSMGTNVSP
jgi:death-on-curing protein